MAANAISHVALFVKTENQEAAVATYSQLLDIEFDGPFPYRDVIVYISWDAGIEICAPNPDAAGDHQAPFFEGLEEGLWRLVFDVPDLEATMARAKEMGYADTVQLFDGLTIAPEQWSKRFTSLDGAFLTKPVCGVGLSLIHKVERG